jgi:hypothetical protein
MNVHDRGRTEKKQIESHPVSPWPVPIYVIMFPLFGCFLHILVCSKCQKFMRTCIGGYQHRFCPDARVSLLSRGVNRLLSRPARSGAPINNRSPGTMAPVVYGNARHAAATWPAPPRAAAAHWGEPAQPDQGWQSRPGPRRPDACSTHGQTGPGRACWTVRILATFYYFSDFFRLFPTTQTLNIFPKP